MLALNITLTNVKVGIKHEIIDVDVGVQQKFINSKVGKQCPLIEGDVGIEHKFANVKGWH